MDSAESIGSSAWMGMVVGDRLEWTTVDTTLLTAALKVGLESSRSYSSRVELSLQDRLWLCCWLLFESYCSHCLETILLWAAPATKRYPR